MKLGILAATALLTSTIISTPAFAVATGTPSADVANSTTLAAMQTQCDTVAAQHGTAPDWTGAYVLAGSTLVSGPTEVGGTGDRIIDAGSITPLGTYVPSVKEIRGNPVRTGGSVNLFGEQWSTAGYFPDSTYTYTADFSSTFADAFTCNITQVVHHHDLVTAEVPATPGTGHHYRMDGNTHAQNCVEMDARGDYFGVTGPGPGADDPTTDPNAKDEGGTCLWAWDTQPTPAIPAVYHDYDTQVVTNEAGGSINQDQSDTLSGFEAHGGVVQVTGEHDDGQVLVCNSPGSKGGTWKAMNGYSGGSFTGSGSPAAPGCNTPYFKIAPITTGSTTSQGTFTSVPNYHL